MGGDIKRGSAEEWSVALWLRSPISLLRILYLRTATQSGYERSTYELQRDGHDHGSLFVVVPQACTRYDPHSTHDTIFVYYY